MAGLQQYYFFPTDFFYPRPPPAAPDAAAVLPVQAIKDDYANPTRTGDPGLVQQATSAATPRAALSASLTEKDLKSRTPIIAEPKKPSDRGQEDEE